MARTATYEKREIDEAIRLVESAKTVQQLRQGQAILIPALTGASMEDTARIKYWAQPGLRHAADVPGVRRNHLRRQGSSGRASSSTPEPGGRESVSGSLAFRSQERKVLVVPSLHAGYAERVEKKFSRSIVYRLLARHG